MQQIQTTPIELTLADWAFNDNEYAESLHYFQEVQQHEPLNADANLGIIENFIALGDKKRAHQLLQQLSQKHITFDMNQQRRIANAWAAVGELQKALVLFDRLKQKDLNAAPSQDSALLFRDAARIETQLRHQKTAQADYKKAMVQSQITPIWPATNNSYTLLTRNHAEDDWLKRSIRSEAAQLYQQQ